MEPSSFPEHAPIQRSDSLVSADLAGDTVLLNIENSKYFGFEAVGSRVWDLLDAPTTLATICSTLLEEFDVDRARCQQDVGLFLSKLAQSQLIVVGDDTHP